MGKCVINDCGPTLTVSRIFLFLALAFLRMEQPALLQAATSSEQARLNPIANGIELTSGASTLDVQIVEDRVVRVHIRLEDKSAPRTLVLNPNFRQPSPVQRLDRKGNYVLSAKGLSVRVQEAYPFTITILDPAGRRLLESNGPFGEARNASVTMFHSGNETLYGIHGLGRTDTIGSLTRNEGGLVAAGKQGDSGAPFLFTAHYGFLIDSDGGEFTATPESFTFLHNSRPDIEYFVMVGSPLQTMAALSRLAGSPPLPPKWTLGFLNSQWGSTQAEVEEIVARYRKEQLPIDGFILDFDWKAWGEDNYGEWRWNSTSGPGNAAPDKFPDGANGDFARRLDAEGVKLVGILKPRILITVAGDPNQPTTAAAYATEHNFWYPDEAPSFDYFSHRLARDLDFNNPDERGWFWEHLLPAFHAGMVGWWNDEADVSGKTIFNNFQFLNMGRTLYEGQRASSNQRVWSINRNFYLGASRYGAALWSGDIDSGFASMAFQPRRMIAALNTGAFHWSMDTGGFSGHPNPENYARWMEFAAFVPIMRVHGGHNEKRQPWVYGPVAEEAARKALELRYELLPYIYSYERLGTEGEVGLVRPLAWEFPNDSTAAAQDSEWMFGAAFLVAPIVTEGATSKQIYLPPGDWFDYTSGRHYQGGRSIQIPIDATFWKDIPLYIREGSILATQPLEQYVGQSQIAEITLDIFPSTSAASFTVYDDDGYTYNYEKGEYLRQQITSVRKGHGTLITLNPATGSYASPLHDYLLKIHTKTRSVTLNGKELTRVDSLVRSLDAEVNWTARKDQFGPVILLKVPAGARTLTTISLR